MDYKPARTSRLSPLAPELWGVGEVLAVVAHPDDESFGLGAVLSWLGEEGLSVDLLCFTAGEASTVGASADLGSLRRKELEAAAQVLGLRNTWLEGLPDDGLDRDPAALEAAVERYLGDSGALIVLEPSGVTGHPDHRAATAAAEVVAARAGLPVLEWGVAPAVAAALADELQAPLRGLEGPEVIEVVVDRSRQREAISCHKSQDPDNPLLLRRLELQGCTERLRVRSAPFEPRLARFVAEASSLARATADFGGREKLLDLLIAFAAGGTWPDGAFEPGGGGRCGVHLLHNDSEGWSISTLVLEGGGATPPHDHGSWGAAATVLGLERNVRLAGICPDRLRPLDAQLVPRGSGYLFDAGGIHQSSDATGRLTVSVHLLVNDGYEAHGGRGKPL